MIDHIILRSGIYQVVIANIGTCVDKTRFPLVFSAGNHAKYTGTWQSVSIKRDDEEISTCLLFADCGPTVHDHSAVCVEKRCYVAVGAAICSLAIPDLSLEWNVIVDSATCFGIYYIPEFQCLISHGELEISRIDLAGRIKWQISGRDIFSEGFAVREQFVEATDFYNTTYRIDLETGQIVAELPAPGGT